MGCSRLWHRAIASPAVQPAGSLMSWRTEMPESGLTGRVAVVTGAGTGLGKAISRALAEAGADLLLHYRSSVASLEGVAAECRALGRRVEIERADFAADPGLAAAVVD